jgi:hypothetical protein
MKFSNVLPFRTVGTSHRQDQEHDDGRDKISLISVGCDQKLLHLREELLKSLGLPVLSLTPAEAAPYAHTALCRIWIFCSTLSRDELLYLASSVCRHDPMSKLLLLSGIHENGIENALFNCVLGPASTIDDFLKAVTQLAESCRRQQKAR